MRCLLGLAQALQRRQRIGAQQVRGLAQVGGAERDARGGCSPVPTRPAPCICVTTSFTLASTRGVLRVDARGLGEGRRRGGDALLVRAARGGRLEPADQERIGQVRVGEDEIGPDRLHAYQLGGVRSRIRQRARTARRGDEGEQAEDHDIRVRRTHRRDACVQECPRMSRGQPGAPPGRSRWWLWRGRAGWPGPGLGRSDRHQIVSLVVIESSLSSGGCTVSGSSPRSSATSSRSCATVGSASSRRRHA